MENSGEREGEGDQDKYLSGWQMAGKRKASDLTINIKDHTI